MVAGEMWTRTHLGSKVSLPCLPRPSHAFRTFSKGPLRWHVSPGFFSDLYSAIGIHRMQLKCRWSIQSWIVVFRSAIRREKCLLLAMSVMDVAVLNLSGRYFHFQARKFCWLVAWFVFVFCLCFLSCSSGGSWQSHFHSKSVQVNAEQSAADLKSLVAMSWKVGISVTPHHTVPEVAMISNVPIQSIINHCILWKSDHFQCNYSALNVRLTWRGPWSCDFWSDATHVPCACSQRCLICAWSLLALSNSAECCDTSFLVSYCAVLLFFYLLSYIQYILVDLFVYHWCTITVSNDAEHDM